MRITNLHVDRFGVWHDLSLSLPASGASVLYGPNEAGKTTLLRLIRGVLFGFTPSLRLLGEGQDGSFNRRGPFGDMCGTGTMRSGGSLEIEAEGRSWEVRRTVRPVTRTLQASGSLSARDGDDELSVTGVPRGGDAAGRLAALLAGCDETLFNHVFALGLHELQELATLEADEVARHIYGMTLGPQARSLLDAVDRLQGEREKLLAADGRSGRLAELLGRDVELAGALRALPDFRQRHQQLTRQRQALEGRIAELKARQAGYHSQLRGHVFLERVYTPWKQVRECEAELDRLPVVSAFPDGGLKRLDELEAELDSQRRCRDALQAEAREFQEQAQALAVNPEWARHQATLESLVEQQPWVEEAVRQAAAAEARVAALDTELEQQRSALDGWEAGLEAIDTSPAAHARLQEAARDYRAAKARWRTVRQRYDRLNKTTRQREAELAASQGARAGRSVAETLSAAKSRLAGLEALSGLRIREAELTQRGRGLSEQLSHIEARMTLPQWVYIVLAVFGGFGVLFAIGGLVAGATSSILSGAAYVFIGATCGISAWALKTHFESQTREQIERLEDERRANEVALRETRREIGRLTDDCDHEPVAPGRAAAATGEQLCTKKGTVPFPQGSSTSPSTTGRGTVPFFVQSPGEQSSQFEWEGDPHATWEGDAASIPRSDQFVSGPSPTTPPPATDPVSEDTVVEVPLHSVLNAGKLGAAPAPAAPIRCEAAPGDSELIRQALHRVAELERLAALEQQIRQRRRRLAEFRSRMPGVQRQLSAARQAWCEAVRRSGLPETVEIREALENWRRAAQFHSTRERLSTAAAERDRHRQVVEAWRRRIVQLGRQLHGRETVGDDPSQVLLDWGNELEGHRQVQAERRRLRQEERRRRREAGQYERRIADLEMRRSALLVQGGAASREEFEQRADWVSRRRESRDLLELAQAELDAAAHTEPDLAIVEEDLLAFDAAENRESLDMINLELEDLEREAQTAFEELGRLKQEIHELETDRRPSRLRYERAQLEAELIDAAQRWCAIERANRVIDGIREVFERTCQPETLAAAAGYLERLTGGRYCNIWTPLGQRRLSIDDDHGRALTVDELSGGTREQLFLAVRLAVVDRLAAGGLELPLVLDDVLVNFDQARTEAAVDALLEFASGGRQVLFLTCHLHLAQLFAARGIEPVWLPGNAGDAARGRLAG